jgi:hypothetical protein
MSGINSTDDTIEYILEILNENQIVYNHPSNNIDYYGKKNRRKHNITGLFGDRNFRICIRTQFVGGGAWQKMIYTYEMLRINSSEEVKIIVYNGTDKRFNHHCNWVKEVYSTKDSKDAVKLMNLIEFTEFMDNKNYLN